LYEIKHFEAFYEDLFESTNYIKNILKNKIAAQNLFEKVISNIEYRADSVALYKKYYTKLNNVYYKININNYSILYTIKDDVMEVRRFLYNKMDIEKMNIIS
jgi:hypothetical protein